MNCAYLFLFLILFAGCSTEFNPATGRQESLMYDDEKEKNLGAGAALQVEKSLTMDNDVDINERVEKIFDKIVAACDRQDLIYTVRVIDDDVMNAFSLPGGYVYIYKGLIDRVKSDDELAAVLAHEVGHITAKHALKRIQGAYGATVLEGVAIATGNGAIARGVFLGTNTIFFQNSRADEFEADHLSIKYMKKAGYDPRQMKVMLGRLLEYQAKQPPGVFNYWRTHPYIPQRMALAEQAAKGSMEFRDYLNITGEEK